MAIKVSIIMPVYNSAKLLSETFDSLLNQSFFDNIEIIAVNDGSSDNSLELLNEYKKSNDNVIVVDQKNGGPSVARNAGLNIAKGEYVYFMDSDDILEEKAIELMYLAAKPIDADMVLAKYDLFNEYTTTPIKNLDNIVMQKYIYKFDTTLLWTFSLCNKLFKRSLIEKLNLRFNENTGYSEDGVFAMSFIYNSNVITGLDEVIYHYRKFIGSEDVSITTSISLKKINDYILSHNLIFEAACNALLKEHPEYSTIEEAIENDNSINFYMNEFYRKEIHILYNQFYKKFWSLSSETITVLYNEIHRLTKKINLWRYNQLLNAHYELPYTLYKDYNEAKNDFKVTAVLFNNSENEAEFISTLNSLCFQNFIPLKIVVAESTKELIKQNELDFENIYYIDANSTNELFQKALDTSDTRYIIFCHSKLRYNNTAILKMFSILNRTHFDFITSLIFTESEGIYRPIDIHKKAFEHFTHFYSYQGDALYDSMYANKLFKVDFLKRIKLNFAENISESINKVFKYGYYNANASCNILYNGHDIHFVKDLLKHSTNEDIKAIVYDEPVTLSSESIINKTEDVAPKLLFKPKKNTLKGRLAKALMKLIRLLPVKDRVFFMNVRKNGDLEGNAKALEPYIKSKKIICSKMLPHKSLYKLKMYYYTFTSKVIICDDYNRYLRVFPLKPEQRVIQLWHACGAFKKFGINGTTLPLKVDLSTHVQYNLVTVSSEAIRLIYAESFGISPKKVKALGCPRTDKFFDEQYIASVKEKIYKEYPNFKDKEVIIYAPTFRDNVPGANRSTFKPNLNFKTLSESLNDNQIFVVCPHPVMKNKIVGNDYDNIFVVRDFSTNDMMLISDLLVTDYSSVIFEYALLRKPIAFFCYDLNKYERGFYLDYEKDLPGELLTNQQNLINHIVSGEFKNTNSRYDLFLEKFMSACDGHSCERIAGLIDDYLNSEEK